MAGLPTNILRLLKSILQRIRTAGTTNPKTNARKTTAPGEVPPRPGPFLFGTPGTVEIVTVIIHILLVL
jgi:hypothetical protein